MEVFMKNIYRNFAYIYDELMHDVDYKQWIDYIEKIFEANKKKPSIIVDLACGTGNLTIEMAKKGYDMVGIDISPDMLSCAKQKTMNEGVDVLYLNQDITEFELYGSVDVALCLMDSINYITHKSKLKRLFKLVEYYLNPGGLFIFDINSQYKLQNVLGENVFFEIGDDVSYIWQNFYDKRKKMCEFDLTFFIKENSYYKKYEEVHIEKAYDVFEIKEIIEESNLRLVRICDNLTFRKPNKKSERIFFICSKN